MRQRCSSLRSCCSGLLLLAVGVSYHDGGAPSDGYDAPCHGLDPSAFQSWRSAEIEGPRLARRAPWRAGRAAADAIEARPSLAARAASAAAGAARRRRPARAPPRGAEP